MPPASYWLGWAWARAFGAAEARSAGPAWHASATAAALVFGAARRAFGSRGMGRGPGLRDLPVIVGSRSRSAAYPLFLLASAASYLAMSG